MYLLQFLLTVVPILNVVLAGSTQQCSAFYGAYLKKTVLCKNAGRKVYLCPRPRTPQLTAHRCLRYVNENIYGTFTAELMSTQQCDAVERFYDGMNWLINCGIVKHDKRTNVMKLYKAYRCPDIAPASILIQLDNCNPLPGSDNMPMDIRYPFQEIVIAT